MSYFPGNAEKRIDRTMGMLLRGGQAVSATELARRFERVPADSLHHGREGTGPEGPLNAGPGP